MRALEKDWDQHVVYAEEVARSDGFRALRDEIANRSAPAAEDRVVDIGSGTGLLTLALAPAVARVTAVDISPAMCDYLAAKAASAEFDNVDCVVASAVSLPLVDESADLVVSNYCFHHLNDDDKLRALREIRRVLVPGGRLVFGDMMFRVSLGAARDRQLISQKVRAIARRGPAGVMRLLRNGVRFAAGAWEKPARADWWEQALAETGFTDVQVAVLAHEGGIASGRKRGPAGAGPDR